MANFNEQIVAQSDPVAILAKSTNWIGVLGVIENAQTNGIPAGVYGLATNGQGVVGESVNRIGVLGVIERAQTTGAPAGVFGLADRSAGVIGVSTQWHGVYGETKSSNGGAGVTGQGTNIGVRGISPNGIAVLGQGKTAGSFEGKVQVKGDVEVSGDIRLTNADCAEEFDIAATEGVDPGTVMVLGSEGALHPSERAYDKRVAGIVSGAGTYRPALVLDQQQNGENRLPIALMGKVFCKVDASLGAVEIGDLLTTSPTPGHAMKAADPLKAFGAVIGKALRPLEAGQGLIPVLVSLQ
jgi:hypothetical protein